LSAPAHDAPVLGDEDLPPIVTTRRPRTANPVRIVVDPRDANVVYVAALGHAWGPNRERGLYKSTNGGTTWELVKFVSDKAGFVDVQLEPGGQHAQLHRQRQPPRAGPRPAGSICQPGQAITAEPGNPLVDRRAADPEHARCLRDRQQQRRGTVCGRHGFSPRDVAY